MNKSTDNQIPTLLLRTNEAAQALGISRATLYKLLRERRLPVVKIDSSTRIPLAALQDWVVRNTQEF